MAPEQAGGHRAGRDDGDRCVRTRDSVLYALLAGQVAVRRRQRGRDARRRPHAAAEPPSRAQPEGPADLEIICLKCLEKEPSRRYASARDLADDLRRWLAGEPIAASRSEG